MPAVSDGRRREGRHAPYLPSGYRVDETDRELAVLRRPDSSEVAVFGERADPREIERAAWEDHRQRGG